MRGFRITTRALMLLVAIVALFIGGVFQAVDSDGRLKREIRSRLSVVESIESDLEQCRSRVESLRWRIAKSDAQSTRDPRHPRWLREISYWKSRADHYARLHTRYERVVWRPWEAFPLDAWIGRMSDYHIDPNLHESIVRWHYYTPSFERAYRRWALGWAALIAIMGLAFGAIVALAARRTIARRRPVLDEHGPLVESLPPWLLGLSSSPDSH